MSSTPTIQSEYVLCKAQAQVQAPKPSCIREARMLVSIQVVHVDVAEEVEARVGGLHVTVVESGHDE